MSRQRKTSMIPIALTLSLLLPAPIVASRLLKNQGKDVDILYVVRNVV